MNDDVELGDGHLGWRRAALGVAVVVAVGIGVQPLLGGGWFVSELWLGTLVSLAVLLFDRE